MDDECMNSCLDSTIVFRVSDGNIVRMDVGEAPSRTDGLSNTVSQARGRDRYCSHNVGEQSGLEVTLSASIGRSNVRYCPCTAHLVFVPANAVLRLIAKVGM